MKKKIHNLLESNIWGVIFIIWAISANINDTWADVPRIILGILSFLILYLLIRRDKRRGLKI